MSEGVHTLLEVFARFVQKVQKPRSAVAFIKFQMMIIVELQIQNVRAMKGFLSLTCGLPLESEGMANDSPSDLLESSRL
jgi:hypothetical protein